MSSVHRSSVKSRSAGWHPIIVAVSKRMSVSRTICGVFTAACLATVGTLALLVGGASGAGEVCGTRGLTPAIVRHSESILGEVAEESGAPVCKVATRKGIAYVSIY